MHPRTAEVLGYFAAQREVLRRAAAAVPLEYHTRRPAAERWSIAQVLVHVAIVERRIIKILGWKLEAARASGLGPELESGPVVLTFPLERVARRGEQIEAMPSVLPPDDADSTAAWTALSREQESLQALLATFDGLALGQVSAPNPVLGELNVYEWVIFLGAHEARHASQITEIARILGASAEAGRS